MNKVDGIITIRQSAVTAMISACPRKVEIEYVEGRTAPYTSALFIGSMFHETYERFFRRKMANGTTMIHIELVEYYEDLFANRWTDDIEMRKGETKEGLFALGLSLINMYYDYACKLEVVDVERKGEIKIRNFVITTHLDVLCTDRIVEEKTARVSVGRNGEYFPDYEHSWDRESKPQPMIHRMIFPELKLLPYHYMVVGKGKTDLVLDAVVNHSDDAIRAFGNRVLWPTLRMIEAGVFPAHRSGLCTICPWAKNSKVCGMLL